MVKNIEDSTVAKEIKKEYLKEHLNEVKNFIEIWLRELSAPPPFGRNREQSSWGWQVIYIPSVEQDPDKNHMLRHHLKSRRLWTHHTNWEHELKTVWDFSNQVCTDVKLRYMEQLLNKQRQYTEDYLNTALWQGFEVACGNKLRIEYKTPDDQVGLSFGAYRIESSVTSADERTLVEKEHRDFIYEIAGLKPMRTLVDTWNEVSTIQQNIQALVTKALKSKDILHSCRFCKHLWK